MLTIFFVHDIMMFERFPANIGTRFPCHHFPGLHASLTASLSISPRTTHLFLAGPLLWSLVRQPLLWLKTLKKALGRDFALSSWDPKMLEGKLTKFLVSSSVGHRPLHNWGRDFTWSVLIWPTEKYFASTLDASNSFKSIDQHKHSCGLDMVQLWFYPWPWMVLTFRCSIEICVDNMMWSHKIRLF